MWLFKRFVCILCSCSVFFLSACGFKPLYAPYTLALKNTIYVLPIDTPDGALLRHALQAYFPSPKTPETEWLLDITLSIHSDFTSLNTAGFATHGSVIVTAVWRIRSTVDTEPVYTQQTSATATYTFTTPYNSEQNKKDTIATLIASLANTIASNALTILSQ